MVTYKRAPPFFLIAVALLLSSLACIAFTQAIEAISPPQEYHAPPENDSRPQCEDCPEANYEYTEDGRPILSGPEQTLASEHFLVHYTTEGRDAVPSTEYVSQIIQTMEYVWEQEINLFGWTAPPPDGAIGGDSRYDVYLQEILADDTFGYTEASEGIDGDNPNSPQKELRASASYLVLDNDYAGSEDFSVGTFDPLDIMRTTAAHEFNHSIQFGYDAEEPADWLWEATATWMQDEIYDEINDGNEDLLAVFKSPDTCQIAYGGEERTEDENHWYGEWIFLRHISERYGSWTVRAIWEYAITLDGYPAIAAALADQGTSLEDVFTSFSIALLTRDFEEGSDYPTVRLEGKTQPGTTFTPVDGVGQMAADYVEIIADGIITLRITDPDLQGLLVGLTDNQASVFPLPEDGTSINASEFDFLYLLILNLEQAESEAECYLNNYEVVVEVGGIPIAAQTQFLAPNFTPPQVEPLQPPDSFGNSVDAPSQLLPDYLPAEYTFVAAYTMSADEFGSDAIWYVPGGGEVTAVDFYGPEETDYLSLYASPSPYTDLNAWLAEANYQPSEADFHTLNGVQALIEDYSDESGPFSYAYVIYDGQFIALEGTISTQEMQWVLESLLTR